MKGLSNRHTTQCSWWLNTIPNTLTHPQYKAPSTVRQCQGTPEVSSAVRQCHKQSPTSAVRLRAPTTKSHLHCQVKGREDNPPDISWHTAMQARRLASLISWSRKHTQKQSRHFRTGMCPRPYSSVSHWSDHTPLSVTGHGIIQNLGWDDSILNLRTGRGGMGRRLQTRGWEWVEESASRRTSGICA